MCVIFIAETRNPTFKELKLASEANSDGGGMAWTQGGRVHFEKGLAYEEIQVLIKINKPTFPYVVHFRLATIGGDDYSLNHPFPVTATVKKKLKGAVEAPVLFHNGHYSSWQETLIPLRAIHDMPKGKWSDSRGLAWLAHHTNLKALDLVEGQRIAILDPAGQATYYGGGWTKNNGLIMSNRLWEHGGYTVTPYNPKARYDFTTTGDYNNLYASTTKQGLAFGAEEDEAEQKRQEAYEKAWKTLND